MTARFNWTRETIVNALVTYRHDKRPFAEKLVDSYLASPVWTHRLGALATHLLGKRTANAVRAQET